LGKHGASTQRPPISFTHIFILFFLVCDIIFIGFSFDDEKENFVLVEGERVSEKSGKKYQPATASVNFDVETRTAKASGGKKAPLTT
jgi:hypothetical protein